WPNPAAAGWERSGRAWSASSVRRGRRQRRHRPWTLRYRHSWRRTHPHCSAAAARLPAAAVFPLRLWLLSSPLRARRSMAHKPKTQGARNWRRFDQLDRHRIAEPVGFRAADKRAAGLVEAKVFVADGARRNKAVG